jgi:hypothetical protein
LRIGRPDGFRDSRVTVKEASKAFIKEWFPGSGIEHYVRSADVQGVKVLQVAASVAQGCGA